MCMPILDTHRNIEAHVHALFSNNNGICYCYSNYIAKLCMPSILS